MAKIFLSYARADETRVREVYRRLKEEGFQPWMDKEELLPGQLWEREIPRALRASEFILIFFSHNSVARRGYIQREYKLALDIWQEIPEGMIHTIPVRLDECDVPEQFRRLQWVDLSDPESFERIVRAIRFGLSARGEMGAVALQIKQAEPPLGSAENAQQPDSTAYKQDKQPVSASSATKHLSDMEKKWWRTLAITAATIGAIGIITGAIIRIIPSQSGAPLNVAKVEQPLNKSTVTKSEPMSVTKSEPMSVTKSEPMSVTKSEPMSVTKSEPYLIKQSTTKKDPPSQVITKEDTPLHSSPNISEKPVATISAGTVLPVHSTEKPGWYYVSTSSTSGWIEAHRVTPQK